MRRSILIVLLGLGVIAGYASAFAAWRYGGYWHHHRYGYWEERHWARICADAAREAGPAPSHSDAPSPDQH